MKSALSLHTWSRRTSFSRPLSECWLLYWCVLSLYTWSGWWITWAFGPAAVHLLPNVKWKGSTTIDHFHTASAYIVFGVCFTPLSMHRLYCWPFSKRLYHLNADCVTIYKHGLNGAQQMNSSIFHRLEMNCNQCILFLKKLNQVSVFLIYLRIGSGLWNTQWNSRSDPIHIVPWMTSMFVCSSRVFFQVGFSDSTAVNDVRLWLALSSLTFCFQP